METLFVDFFESLQEHFLLYSALSCLVFVLGCDKLKEKQRSRRAELDNCALSDLVGFNLNLVRIVR